MLGNLEIISASLLALSLMPSARKKIDHYTIKAGDRILGLLGNQTSDTERRVRWINFILAQIRSGKTTRRSLELSTNQSFADPQIKALITKILNGQDTTEPIAKVLSKSIETGSSCTGILKKLKKNLERQNLADRKAYATTIQLRAQSAIMVLLPWLLFIAQSVLSPDIFQSAISNTITIGMLLLAILLSVAGLYWMCQLNKTALKTKSAAERRVEDSLVLLLNDITGQILSGESPANILDKPIAVSIRRDLLKNQRLINPFLKSLFSNLKDVVDNSMKLGIPVADQVSEMNDELMNYFEIKLIERSQILPLKMLLPITLTVLPSSFITIAAPIVPLLLRALEF